MVKSLTTSPKSIFRTITGKSTNTIETQVTTHYNHYSRSVDSSQYYHQPQQQQQASQAPPREVRTLKQSDFTPMLRAQDGGSGHQHTTAMATAAITTTTSMTSKYISTTLPSQSHSVTMQSYCSTATTATTASSSSNEMLEPRCQQRYEYNDSHNYRSATTAANQLNGNTNHLSYPTMTDGPQYENTYQYAATVGSQSSSSYGSDAGAPPLNATSNGDVQHGHGVAEGRYGKILANRGKENVQNGCGGSGNYQSAHNHDRFNANGQYQQPSSSLPPQAAARHSRSIDNGVNNNNPTPMTRGVSNNGYNCMSPTAAAMSNGVPMKSATINSSMGKGNAGTAMLVRPTPPLPPNKDGVNGNGLLRAAHPQHRYSNSHLTAGGNHPLAHLIGSLSSPESAYSTGYSTDGTSPGKQLALLPSLSLHFVYCTD